MGELAIVKQTGCKVPKGDTERNPEKAHLGLAWSEYAHGEEKFIAHLSRITSRPSSADMETILLQRDTTTPTPKELGKRINANMDWGSTEMQHPEQTAFYCLSDFVGRNWPRIFWTLALWALRIFDPTRPLTLWSGSPTITARKPSHSNMYLEQAKRRKRGSWIQWGFVAASLVDPEMGLDATLDEAYYYCGCWEVPTECPTGPEINTASIQHQYSIKRSLGCAASREAGPHLSRSSLLGQLELHVDSAPSGL
jgi:hypothetical protein